MKAMLLRRTGPWIGDSQPLEAAELPVPTPRQGEILLAVIESRVMWAGLALERPASAIPSLSFTGAGLPASAARMLY